MSVRRASRGSSQIRTISRVGQRRQVVIPALICQKLALRVGDFVEVGMQRNQVVIRPKKLVDAENVLTPQEGRQVARGFRQLKRGQYVSWAKLKNELGL